jgi:O-antigen ligase
MPPSFRTISPLALLSTASLILALVYATLMYGGDFEFARAFLVLPAGVALLLAPRPPVTLSPWLVWGVAVPVLLVMAWVAVQLMPLGTSALGPMFWQAAPLTPPWASFSIAPGETLLQGVLALSYILMTVAAYRLTFQPAFPGLMLRFVVLTGGALACYSLAVFLTGNQSVAFMPKHYYPGMLTGTFIYHNTYAAFMGFCMLATLALMFEHAGNISSRVPRKQQFMAFYTRVLRARWYLVPLWMLEAGTLILSNSRAGVACVLLGHGVFLASLFAARKPLRIPLMAVGALFAIMLCLVLAAAGHTLGARLATLAQQTDGRASIAANTLLAIDEAPLTGTGLGTLPTAVRIVRPFGVYETTEHAHHLYLELVQEMGLPATLLLGLAAGTALALLLYGVTTRKRKVVWPALGAATLAQVATHGMVDFTLAIPAVAILALLILTPALVFSTHASAAPRPLPIPFAMVLEKIIMLALLVPGLWVFVPLLLAQPAMPTLQSIRHGDTVPVTELKQAEGMLRKCTQLNPLLSSCTEGLARVRIAEAAQTPPNTPASFVALARARDALQQALAANPANPTLWYRLAQVDLLLGNRKPATHDLLQSIAFGPLEKPLATTRLPLAAAMWKDLTLEEQTFFLRHQRDVQRDNPQPTWKPKTPDVLPPAASLEGLSLPKQA